MLEHDRKQAGWSVGQAAWRLGVRFREYREIEAGERWPNWEISHRIFDPDELVADVRDGSVAAVAQGCVRVLASEVMNSPMDIRQSAAVGAR